MIRPFPPRSAQTEGALALQPWILGVGGPLGQRAAGVAVALVAMDTRGVLQQNGLHPSRVRRLGTKRQTFRTKKSTTLFVELRLLLLRNPESRVVFEDEPHLVRLVWERRWGSGRAVLSESRRSRSVREVCESRLAGKPLTPYREKIKL